MIHFVYKTFLLLLFVPLWDSDGDFTKNYHKEYDVPSDATVELINKYGFTKVHAWDKHIVTIDVNIVANTNSKDRAEEIFDKININFTTTNTYIKAETVINNPSKSWWDWKSWIGIDNSNSSSYKINYDVYMPTDQYLKLSHKYGDAFVDRMDRNSDIKVSYGHLRLEGVNADLDLDLAYSDGTIGDIKDGKINLRYSDITMAGMQDGSLNFKYSDIKMKEAGDIKAECAYGDLHADKIKTIDIHSRYDDIVIRAVDDIYANGAYSDFDIGEVKDNLPLRLLMATLSFVIWHQNSNPLISNHLILMCASIRAELITDSMPMAVMLMSKLPAILTAPTWSKNHPLPRSEVIPKMKIPADASRRLCLMVV